MTKSSTGMVHVENNVLCLPEINKVRREREDLSVGSGGGITGESRPSVTPVTRRPLVQD